MADFPVLPRTPPGLSQKERVECAMGFMADWEAAFQEPAPKRRASLDFPNGSAASATTPSATPSFPYGSADNPSHQRGFAGGSGRSRGRRSSLDVPRSAYDCDSQGRPAEAGRDESAAAVAAAAAACAVALERNSIQGPLPADKASPSQAGGRRASRNRTGKWFQEPAAQLGSAADEPQSSSQRLDQAARGRSAASAAVTVADGSSGAPGAAGRLASRGTSHRHANGFGKGNRRERVDGCGGRGEARPPHPDATWPAGEGKLQEWVDWTVVDLSLRPQGLMQARAAMIANGCGGGRKVSPTS